MSTTPDREQLIELCERGIVPEVKWSNRDSSAAHRQLGEAWALLRAGCDFHVSPEVEHNAWWVHVDFDGFNRFEYGRDEAPKETERYYIPTAESLAAADDGDWY